MVELYVDGNGGQHIQQSLCAAAGPVDRSVALNAQITVAFSSAVAEFLMPGALTLQTGGTIVPHSLFMECGRSGFDAHAARPIACRQRLHGDLDRFRGSCGAFHSGPHLDISHIERDRSRDPCNCFHGAIGG